MENKVIQNKENKMAYKTCGRGYTENRGMVFRTWEIKCYLEYGTNNVIQNMGKYYTDNGI